MAWTLQTLSANALELSSLWIRSGFAQQLLVDVEKPDFEGQLPMQVWTGGVWWGGVRTGWVGQARGGGRHGMGGAAPSNPIIQFKSPAIPSPDLAPHLHSASPCKVV